MLFGQKKKVLTKPSASPNGKHIKHKITFKELSKIIWKHCKYWIDSGVGVLLGFSELEETLFRRVWFGGGPRAPWKGQHSPAEIETVDSGTKEMPLHQGVLVQLAIK